MTPHRLPAASYVIALSLVATAAPAAAPSELEHNPFARPAWETVADERVPILAGPATSVSMGLRATMVGRQGSLANVAGTIVAIGENVQGFQLVAVFEDRAVFEHQGDRITVYVRPPKDEADE